MDLPIKLAVIGCGAAFENLYLKPLRRLQRRGWIWVVALGDPAKVRRELAQKFFPSARTAATAKEVLVGGDVALTIICSPPPFHLAHMSAAFEAGSQVLCEKPIADTVAAGREMVALAQKLGCKLAIGQTRRFYPCLVEAKRLLTAGRLGRVLSYSYQEGGIYLWPVASDAAFRRATSGGGVLLDKGGHALDLLCWLFGPARVVSHADDVWTEGTECASETFLDHAGVRGRLMLAWDQETANGCLIRGEKGDLWLPTGAFLHDLFFRPQGGAWEKVPVAADFAAEVDGAKRAIPRVYFECFDFQLIQVLRAICHGEPVPVDGQEALVSLQVIESAYAQARPLEQPWLPLVEQKLTRQRHWRALASAS